MSNRRRACCCGGEAIEPCASAFPYLFPKYIKVRMPDVIKIPDYTESINGVCEPDVQKVYKTQWVPDYLYLECDGGYFGTPGGLYKGRDDLFVPYKGRDDLFVPWVGWPYNIWSISSAARYKIHGTNSDPEDACYLDTLRYYFDPVVFCGWMPVKAYNSAYWGTITVDPRLEGWMADPEAFPSGTAPTNDMFNLWLYYHGNDIQAHMQAVDGNYGLFRPYTALRINMKPFHFGGGQVWNYDLSLTAFAWLDGDVSSNDVCLEMEARSEHSIAGGCTEFYTGAEPYPCAPFGNRDLSVASPAFELQIPCPPNLIYPSVTGFMSDITGGATNRYQVAFTKHGLIPIGGWSEEPLFQEGIKAWTWGFKPSNGGLPYPQGYLGPGGFTIGYEAIENETHCSEAGYMKSSLDLDLLRLQLYAGNNEALLEYLATGRYCDFSVSESRDVSWLAAWGLTLGASITPTTITPGRELGLGFSFCPLQTCYADDPDMIEEWA